MRPLTNRWSKLPNAEFVVSLPPGLGHKANHRIINELERNGAWAAMQADSRSAVIITLIHGTWGTRSELANDESHFCNILREELKEPAHFSIFRWSGDNTHVARIAASIKLRQYLAEVRSNFPTYPHYLICHSHGGNIALYALKDDFAASAVSGVITLSTPFIHARQRPFNFAVRYRFNSEHAEYIKGFAFILLSISLIADIFFHDSKSLLYPLTEMLFGIFILIGTFRRRPIVSAIFSDMVAFENAISLPARLTSEILIMRTPADEASGILSIGSMTAWMSTRILTPIIDFIRTFHTSSRFILIFYGTMMTGLIVNMAAHYFPFSDQETEHYMMAIGSIGRTLLAFGAGLLGLLKVIPLVVSIVCWLMARPYGAGIGLRIATNLEMTAESAPPGGPWPIYNVLPPRWRHFFGASRDVLMHSRVYRSESAIAIMALWIRAGSGASEYFVKSRHNIDRFARIFRS